jgi:hypothetical protein
MSVSVSRPDIRNSLKGFIDAKSPLERGQIYRDAIREVVDDPGNATSRIMTVAKGTYIDAGNVLGTLVGNIISQRTLDLIFQFRPPLKNVVTDFSSDGALYNQTVYSRLVGIPTVGDFMPVPAAASPRADVDYPVTLNLAKQVSFTYGANEFLATQRDLVKEGSEALAVALGNYLMDAVTALITVNFVTQTVQASNQVTYPNVISFTKSLNEAGVPSVGRFAWVNSEVAAALRSDEIVMEQFDRQNSVPNAHWKGIEGFDDIWECPALPDNGINLTGFFAQRNALLIASRTILDPQRIVDAGYPGKIQIVTDPVTQLSVVSNRWVDQNTMAVTDRLIALFGCARGNLTCGQRLVSA